MCSPYWFHPLWKCNKSLVSPEKPMNYYPVWTYLKSRRMKPQTFLHEHHAVQALQVFPEQLLPKAIPVQFKKVKKQKQIPPPDEESCMRLNAMAKQSPFCTYYKEKSYDPL